MDDPLEFSDTVLRSVLADGSAYLDGKGIGEPALNAELLLCDLLGLRRGTMRLDSSRRLTTAELHRYLEFLIRRGRHEPLQYILGQTEFYGEYLSLSPHVLIPRPETELLVETVLGLFRERMGDPLSMLDLGTGSGNIAIPLAKRLPHVHIDAVDISPEAISGAAGNVRRHRLEKQITLIQADMQSFRPVRRYDAIVSNPPYVSEQEFLQLQPEIRDFEPADAVTDHADGLTFYRYIAAIGKTHLTPGGAIVLEIAYNQGEQVVEILHSAGYSPITVLKDYSGHDRVVHTG